MPSIKTISDNVSVSGWLDEEDFAKVRALGFDKVINFRPDNEAPDQISSAEAEAAAHEAGLEYVQIPVTRNDLFTDEVVSRAAREFATRGPGPRLLRIRPARCHRLGGGDGAHATCR